MRTREGDAVQGVAFRRDAAGSSLVELLAVITLVGITAGLGASALGDGLQRGRLRACGRDLATRVRGLRTEAVLSGRHVGLVFDRGRDYAYTVHRDGNGNGIRTADVRAGVDPRIGESTSLVARYPGVSVAISPPGDVPEIPPRPGKLAKGDPLKLGPVDIMSCSPQGTCTSGTIYFSSGASLMIAVRVRGWNAQVQVWDYDARGQRWRRT